MVTFEEIKDHYNFREDDARKLISIRPLMIEHVEGAMTALHSWMLQTAETAKFFTQETRRLHVFDSQKNWYIDLFSGSYDSRYHGRLLRIGQKHVKFRVNAHYMNRSINIVRTYCMELLSRKISDHEERIGILSSLEKILDINLDIITSSYIEEEMRIFTPGYRVKNALISFSEGFSRSMNLILVFSLIALTVGVVVLFIYDIRKFLTVDLEHGIITALGSVMILWIMIELMDTEISHLKGRRFRISVFIGVALVSFIRKTMIASIKKETPEVIYYLTAMILVTGVIYWLVRKTEEKET